ncbi:MAG: VWA domain-containing protein, partial [Mycobacterium sp.]
AGTAGASLSVVVGASRRPATDDGVPGSGALTYPEWDLRRRAYRADWCTVIESEPSWVDGSTVGLPPTLPLRRALTRLAVGLQRCGRQRQGDDIDIDAAVQARVQSLAGSGSDDEVYLDFLRRKRELSVMLLLDISGSAKEIGHGGRPVHEHQRATAGVLASTLYELGDRVALYGFCSQGRSAVYLTPVKRFDEVMGGGVLANLDGLVPGGYSRLGAAIRHGTAVLKQSAGTGQQLLVVLTDGLAYDHGYEREHGAADARRALVEARHAGVGCLCLTVGAATEAAELRRVFGTTAHAAVSTATELSGVVGPLFRSALQSAELRSRKSPGANKFRATPVNGVLNLISVPR